MKKLTYSWCQMGACVIALLLGGCATARVNALVNRERDRQSFNRVMICSGFQNIYFRRIAENTFCAEFMAATGVTCVRSFEVFFPGENYSEEQVEDRLNELQIDAVFLFQPIGSGMSSTYIPRTSYTTGSTTVGPKSITGFFTTLTFGGFYVSKPWADYEGILWSTADDRVAWYATATAKGNAFANMENLIASASKKIARRLVADGVFQKIKR